MKFFSEFWTKLKTDLGQLLKLIDEIDFALLFFN